MVHIYLEERRERDRQTTLWRERERGTDYILEGTTSTQENTLLKEGKSKHFLLNFSCSKKKHKRSKNHV